MDVAEIIARRGTCPKKQVGAVLVAVDNTIISTGYNGAPSGLPHCLDVGCLLSPAGKCMRAVHAEMNALERETSSLTDELERYRQVIEGLKVLKNLLV